MKTTWRNSFVTNLNTPFMIGNVEIPNRTVLAPMAGVTNSAFRTIAKELGAGLVVMEMVSDKGIQYNNEKTLHMLHIDEGENPVSIQLFGSDEDSLARAAEFIQENTKTDIVDINMGCPVNKIVKTKLELCGSKIQTRSTLSSTRSNRFLIFPLLSKCVLAGLTHLWQ